MKTKILFSLIGAAAAVLIMVGVFVARGSFTEKGAGTLPECEWPASLDAVAAAPRNHKVVIENDRVRVLDVTVEPGELENLHAHCRSSVMYLIYEGIYKDYGANGELLGENTSPGDPTQFPMTLWVDPQAPHAVHNLDTKPVRLLRVELKD